MIAIVNAISLSNYLSNNLDACITLLEAMDYTQITYRNQRNEIRFSREDGHNPTAMRLKLDTLKFDGFSINVHGNLYSLVMMTKELSFPNALKYIAETLGLEKKQFSKRIRYPFGGFYRGLMKEIQEPEYSMETYDESILENYINKYNLMFLKDGISFQTQKHFKVGFDLETLRITVPEYTLDGKLCGIMGRLNDSKCAKEDRWLPIIPCYRSYTLYGYHYNYEFIQQKNVVIIGESEKFVQQLHSMGKHTGLATCGCDVSEVQARHLKALMTSRIILAYDEGLEEEQVRIQAEKLILNNAVFKNRVGYIFDKENEILPKGSKASPSDFGIGALNELVRNHVVWLDKQK